MVFQAFSNLTKMVFNGSNVLGDQNRFFALFLFQNDNDEKLDAQTITEHPIYSVPGIPKCMKLNRPINRNTIVYNQIDSIGLIQIRD